MKEMVMIMNLEILHITVSQYNPYDIVKVTCAGPCNQIMLRQYSWDFEVQTTKGYGVAWCKEALKIDPHTIMDYRSNDDAG